MPCRPDTCGKLPQVSSEHETAWPIGYAVLVRTGSTRPDAVSLMWLVTVRWTVVLAASGALVAGRTGLGVSVGLSIALVIVAIVVVSNLWLLWRIRTGRTETAMRAAGPLVSLDVLLLMWVLWRSGGVLNPASVFFLVQIVLAALVLGRLWTWIVTSVTIGGYAAMYLSPSVELTAAQVMHPEIAVHMGGMWLAFAATALVIAVLVSALVVSIERRDRALARLRDEHARTMRFAGLATLAAGAAHELSTPLATVAIAARELERSLAADASSREHFEDARLIRSEVDRCRRILDDMAAESGGGPGEVPRSAAVTDVLAGVVAELPATLAERVDVRAARDIRVLWPVQAVTRALLNLVRNALHASPPDAAVSLAADALPDSRVRIAVADSGAGMSPEELARAGEPFFTTRPSGTGTGLGIFVARSTAEQLGGSLSLVSAPGQGTTATLLLPADVLTPMQTDAAVDASSAVR
jgi:two-component system sensor histidine kinase RegB